MQTKLVMTLSEVSTRRRIRIILCGLLIVSTILWIFLWGAYKTNLRFVQVIHPELQSGQIENATDCAQLTQAVAGEYFRTSEEERSFPIAFALSTYSSFERLARVLRLIFREHNIYCIHVDKKADISLKEKVKHLAQCYGPSVFVIPDEISVDVARSYFTVLQSVLLCAQQFLDQKTVEWKYMLNLNEKELPLRTNWEMVRALKRVNGSNIVEGVNGPPVWDRIPSGKLSFQVEWIKGSVLVALRRDFVKFMLTDPKSLEILSVMEAEKHLGKVPEETFFSTLAYNPQLGAPGACLLIRPPNASDPRSWFLTRYVDWDIYHCPSNYIIHGICILGWNDLPILVKQPHLMANKFYPDFQPEAYDFMENWYIYKVLLEQTHQHLDPSFDETIYAKLYCSENHI
ncbi:hypothetical protein T265_04703 [Opisthorchis viverrini]|nr:hypothetical protein T265_04703 [Opisthorchis viverrini]KER28478.1 hypothetical protein T265_04703 [Opisthorchis viverrini]